LQGTIFKCHSYFKAKPQESTHHGNYFFKDCIIVYLYRSGSDHVPVWNERDMSLRILKILLLW